MPSYFARTKWRFHTLWFPQSSQSSRKWRSSKSHQNGNCACSSSSWHCLGRTWSMLSPAPSLKLCCFSNLSFPIQALRLVCMRAMLPLEIAQQIMLQRFIQYIESFWFERIGPARFCVSTDTNRTNNLLEAFHRMLNALMGNAHPSPWFFMDKCVFSSVVFRSHFFGPICVFCPFRSRFY